MKKGLRRFVLRGKPLRMSFLVSELFLDEKRIATIREKLKIYIDRNSVFSSTLVRLTGIEPATSRSAGI